MPKSGRREFVRTLAGLPLGLGSAVLAVGGCRKPQGANLSVQSASNSAAAPLAELQSFPRGDAGVPETASKLVRISLDAKGGGPAEIAVLVPTIAAGSTARFPVVIALHGRGEAQKSPEEGCLGWPRDYALQRAIERMSHPPLTPPDFEDLATETYINERNRELAARPYAGLIVVCPYMPDFDLQKDVATPIRYGRFLIDSVLPRIREEFPAIPTAAATGIDGVSLGGRVAMRVGFTYPESFGAVGGIQPAIQVSEADTWGALAREARQKNPTQQIRLLTSNNDYFREAVERCSATFRNSHIPHEFLSVPGPHDYIFNRGPGAYELLRFHDRALARS